MLELLLDRDFLEGLAGLALVAGCAGFFGHHIVELIKGLF